jgi:LPXTG-motif cell wall-anchored protein
VDHAAEATSATRFFPDASGKLIIKGLEDDTYSITAAATVDGNQVNMKPDGESGNAFVPFVCVNTKGFDLPQTGGHGSYWFPIIGLTGLALAVFGIVLLSRKKTAKDN